MRFWIGSRRRGFVEAEVPASGKLLATTDTPDSSTLVDAINQWWDRGGQRFVDLVQDGVEELMLAARRDDARACHSASVKLSGAAGAAQRYEPMPDEEAQRCWAQGLQLCIRAANAAELGTHVRDVTLLDHASDELRAGVATLRQHVNAPPDSTAPDSTTLVDPITEWGNRGGLRLIHDIEEGTEDVRRAAHRQDFSAYHSACATLRRSGEAGQRYAPIPDEEAQRYWTEALEQIIHAAIAGELGSRAAPDPAMIRRASDELRHIDAIWRQFSQRVVAIEEVPQGRRHNDAGQSPDRFPGAGDLATAATNALTTTTTAPAPPTIPAANVKGTQPSGPALVPPAPPLPSRRRRRSAGIGAFGSAAVVSAAVGAAVAVVLAAAGIGSLSTSTVTIPVGPGARGVAVAPDGRHAYIANNRADTVSVLDTASNTVTATIPVGADPFEVAVAPDGRRAYVTDIVAGAVSVIDTASNTVTATIPVGARPAGVAVAPDGRHVYTANNTDADDDLDPHNDAPSGVALTPDSRRAYITHYWPTTVSVIDTASNTVTATIPVGQNLDGAVSVIDTASNTVTATIPVDTHPAGVAVTPDSQRAYITNSSGKTVSVIDTASNTVTATIPVDTYPDRVAVAPDGRHAYTANNSADTVSVIDTASNTVTATIPVGAGPIGVAVAPDSRHAYTANNSAGTVSVIDTGAG
jgi:YVTN family beta-propeller protein